jgi:YD repeat-containing protein
MDAHIAWWKSDVLGYCQDGTNVKPDAWNTIDSSTPDQVVWLTWHGDCPTTSGGPYLDATGIQAGGTVKRETFTVNDVLHTKKDNACAGNPIYPASGAKRQFEPIGNWFAGSPISLVYDTRSKLPMDEPSKRFAAQPLPSFGSWESTVHKQLVFSDAAVVQASRGGGEWITFTRNADGAFRPDADIADDLKAVPGVGWRYLDASQQTLETYDNAGKLITVADRVGGVLTYTYSDASTPVTVAPGPGWLIKIQDHNGRAVNFLHAASRVTSMLDPAGQEIRFAYDASNNLKSITWADGSVRQFLYEIPTLSWALTGIVDERSIRYATFSYDSVGRAVSTEHAGGTNKYSLNYGHPPSRYVVETVDVPNRIVWRHHYSDIPLDTVLTDPNGNAGSLGFQSIGGMPRLTTRSQPGGSGCSASTSAMTYDGLGNVLSADDFNGNRSCYAYDNTNREVMRVEGLATSSACSSVTPQGAALPAGSRKVSTQWHPERRLETRRAEPGQLSTSVYNGQPDPFNGDATASCAPSTATLPDGKPIAVACKQVVQATIDANGASAFNVTGVPAIEGDPNFANVSLLLHMDGQVGSFAVSDNAPNPKTVTAAGSVQLSSTQAKFGGASSAFDGSGDYWAVPHSNEFSIQAGDFTIEAWVYRSVGGQQHYLLSKRSYSAADGWEWRINADNTLQYFHTGGTQVSSTSAVPTGSWVHLAATRSGSTVRLFIAGVPVGSATFADGNENTADTLKIGVGNDLSGGFNGYIDEVRITKGVARYTAAFTPPSAPFGNSTTSTPAIPSSMDASVPNRVWTYTYNQHGQVLTAKGPRTDVNDTTTYEYYPDTTAEHTVGDLKKVTNAKGQATQYTLYNKAGQVLRSVDANSVTTDYAYDARQRLKSVSVGGQTTSHDYLPSGQLKRVTQPDASYVEYTYDDAQRQVAVSDNLGNRIDYTLDNAGRRTGETVKDPSGTLSRQVSRIMDALGRVQQVTGRE